MGRMYSGKLQNLDFEKYSFSDVDLQVALVKTSVALTPQALGPARSRQRMKAAADQPFCHVALTSDLTDSTHGSPCWASGLRAAFPSWALSELWFVLWRSSEAIYLLEHTVRILSHRVGHGAGKPVECGFRLPCIQERSDSRTFPWHVGWVCCSYSWNPLVAFSEIQSDKNDWTNQQTGCSSEHLSEPYHAVRRSTCSLCQPGGHTVWPFPVSMLEHKGLKKTDRETDRRSQPSKAEMSTVCSQ